MDRDLTVDEIRQIEKFQNLRMFAWMNYHAWMNDDSRIHVFLGFLAWY
jgi:hypothetical protein